jgi:hypothetical protein
MYIYTLLLHESIVPGQAVKHYSISSLICVRVSLTATNSDMKIIDLLFCCCSYYCGYCHYCDYFAGKCSA